jgi:DNA-binding NtrC family response regulator
MTHGRRVLVLDLSEDVLIRVQQVLEDSGIDTTTTAQVGEAVELMATGFFSFLVIGNHPPFLDAAKILLELRNRGVSFDFYILGNGEQGLREYGELVDQIRTSVPAKPPATTRISPGDIRLLIPWGKA